MEQNVPLMARKIWHIVRVAFFMLRKGICKRKLLMDLNLMMKRGKIAGKALGNLMFHHHNQGGATTSHGGGHPSNLQYAAAVAAGEYEFSCSSTPLYRHYFTNNKRKNHHHYNMPSPFEGIEDIQAVNKVLEMMVSNDVAGASSPALPGLGFGLSPRPVRQLRVTDSPFPAHNGEEDHRVDQEAEEFIKKFYSELKQQKY